MRARYLLVPLLLAGCATAEARREEQRQAYFRCRSEADSVAYSGDDAAAPGHGHDSARADSVGRLIKACLVRRYGWKAREADRYVDQRRSREG